MVRNWIKNRQAKRARSLQNDRPEVPVEVNSPQRPISIPGLVTSVFQYNPASLGLIISDNASSPTSLYFVYLNAENSNHAKAIYRSTHDRWLEFIAANDSQPISPTSIGVLTSGVNRALFDIGRGSVTAMHASFFVDLKEKCFYGATNGKFVVAVFSCDGDVTFVDFAKKSPSIGSIEHDFDGSLQQLSLNGVRALAVVTAKVPLSIFQNASRDVLSCPYPKVAAAELFHFALANHSHRSNVIWFEFSSVS